VSATDLLLIRHAEAQAARGSTDQVALDLEQGLTEDGIAQAERLGQWLARPPRPDVLVSSPTLRALQTAEPIGFETGLEIHRAPALEELHLGFPKGVGAEAARRGWDRVRADVDSPAFPTGETFRDFQARVLAALEGLWQTHAGRRVAVVCHGGVIEVSFLGWLGIPLEQAAATHVHVDHTGVFWWRREEGGGLELVRANDTGHLELRS